jgi:hypothetical protein
MASKYLSSGSPAFTVSTRTLTGGTYSASLDSTDVGRGLTFIQSGAVYYSRIAKVTGAATAVLHRGTLPSVDGAASLVTVLDMGETHAYSDYIDAISDKVRDDAASLDASQMKQALQSALAEHSRSSPLKLAFSVTGDSTGLQLLAPMFGAFWKPGYTDIEFIEYPVANPIPVYVRDEEWMVYDDGTAQDGSNLRLKFVSIKPSPTEQFIVTILAQLERPEVGAQNFPDTQRIFEALTALAASHAATMLAAKFAATTGSSISADVVNYNDKSARYVTVARQYRRAYNLLVYGAEDPPSGAVPVMTEKKIEMRDQEGQQYLFHRLRR